MRILYLHGIGSGVDSYIPRGLKRLMPEKDGKYWKYSIDNMFSSTTYPNRESVLVAFFEKFGKFKRQERQIQLGIICKSLIQ